MKRDQKISARDPRELPSRRLRLKRRSLRARSLPPLRIGWLARLAGLAVLLALLVLPGLPYTPQRSEAGGPAILGSNLACNSVSTPTPSALLIPLAGPTVAVQSGGNLSATFELAVVNHTSGNSTWKIYLPSVFVSFPLVSGAKSTIYFSPRTIQTNASGWSNPSLGTRTIQPPGGLALRPGATATLSTQKIAVMASADYGNFTIELRWRWVVTQPNGSVTRANWSVPTYAAHWPTSIPSIFEPAPYVPLLSTTGASATIGLNYVAKLGGFVAARQFLLELEYPGNGTVVQSNYQTSPSQVSSFSVSIVLLNYVSVLAAGTYLVHIHDQCGALVYSLSVRAYYAAVASVAIFVSPSSCGSISLNGSSYPSGSTPSIQPRWAAYAFSIPSCSGHSFQSWQTTGAVHIVSSSLMQISYNGTFSVKYS
jgi:hypothetical protein